MQRNNNLESEKVNPSKTGIIQAQSRDMMHYTTLTSIAARLLGIAPLAMGVLPNINMTIFLRTP